MKKNAIMILSTLIGISAFGQTGINNFDPKATLDIAAKSTDGSKPEGVIAPRLTGDQIKAADSQYGVAQTGTILYATEAVSAPSTKTTTITKSGYYYFDGSIWRKMTGEDEEVNIYKDNGTLKDNRTVTMNDKTLSFNAIPTNGTSHFTVDASTFSVDAINHRVGIGTTTPATKLELNNGTVPGAIKIVDGTQASGKILTSDANGIGSWQDGSLKTLLGKTSTTGALASTGFFYLSNWGTIKITPGTWLVTAKFTSQNSTTSSFASWIKLMNSTTNTEIATAGMIPETVGGRLATPMVQSLITVTSVTDIGVQSVNGCNCAALTSDFGGSQFYAIKLY